MNYVFGQVKPVPNVSKDTVLPKVDSLKAAIVTAVMRPHMKGDTLEYNTEHIKMPPNSMVEELLRRLPGLQVDADGAITYNGEKIQHLLVDGEDIFGSDPTMVTRNFDASKIARVQILDRKSDQAVFTGIDDGTRTKTLNLVMKESEKDGYFGKVEAGGNTDGYYNVNGALAAFRDKEQFTALGLASNMGITGFTSNAGGSPAAVSFLNGNNDPLGASAGTGIPHFAAAALHFANTWNGTTNHLVGNYQYSHYYTQPVTSTATLQEQPDSTYTQYQKSQSTNQQVQHWMYGTFDLALNSRSAFKFTIHANYSQGENQFGATGSSNFNDTLVNSSQRTIRDEISRQVIGGDAAWRIQIGNSANRIFSSGITLSKTDNITDGYLYSLNQFYQANGLIESMDTVDQRKQISSHAMYSGASLSYSEPLWKGAMLGLGYGISMTMDDPLQATYDRGDGKYQVMIDSLSSHFKTQTIHQRMLFNLQGKLGNIGYTIGTDWIGYNYRQHDLIVDSALEQHYSNFVPKVFLNYTPNLSTNVKFTYNASTQQPSVAQLTPLTNNSDPLHITMGNPDLKPGSNQNFYLEFHRFKTWLINVSANLNLINNSISTKTITDSLGRQVSQPVNVNGGRTAGVNVALNRNVLGIDLGIHAAGTNARTVSYINADLSRNDVYTGGGGFSLNKFVADKFSLQLNTNFIYFDQVSSVNTAASVRYWTQNYQGLLTIYLVPDVEIGTSATYTWQGKTSGFASSTSVMLWNAYVGRNFLHNKLVAKLQLNNIFDANAGITRGNAGNVITQASTNILGRYWMLSATYHFDRHFRKKQEASISKAP